MVINNDTIKELKKMADELAKASDSYASIEIQIDCSSIHDKPQVKFCYYASHGTILVHIKSLVELKDLHKKTMEGLHAD